MILTAVPAFASSIPFGTPQVDGVEQAGEWTADRAVFAGLSHGEVGLQNDAENLYIALWLPPETKLHCDVIVAFDVANDGVATGYEDGLVVRNGSSTDTYGGYDRKGAYVYTQTDAYDQSRARVGPLEDGRTLIELVRPLTNRDRTDLSATGGDTVAMCLSVPLGGCLRATFPDGCVNPDGDQSLFHDFTLATAPDTRTSEQPTVTRTLWTCDPSPADPAEPPWPSMIEPARGSAEESLDSGIAGSLERAHPMSCTSSPGRFMAALFALPWLVRRRTG